MASDWKTKYFDIRSKLKEATDVAWRLGYERGMKDGTQAAQMQAMAQQQAQQAAMMGGGAPGQPGGDPSQDPSMQGAAPGGMPPEAGGDQDPEAMMGEAAPGAEEMQDAGGGSELDQHINELESLVAKGEKPSVLEIRKAVQALAGIRKNQKDVWAKKADKIIPAQKKVVDDILKKWESEAKKPSEGLEAIIKEHGLKIGE